VPPSYPNWSLPCLPCAKARRRTCMPGPCMAIPLLLLAWMAGKGSIRPWNRSDGLSQARSRTASGEWWKHPSECRLATCPNNRSPAPKSNLRDNNSMTYIIEQGISPCPEEYLERRCKRCNCLFGYHQREVFNNHPAACTPSITCPCCYELNPMIPIRHFEDENKRVSRIRKFLKMFRGG